MSTENPVSPRQHDPWNKGRLIGQKRPLKPKDVWTIRVRLQLEGRKRDDLPGSPNLGSLGFRRYREHVGRRLRGTKIGSDLSRSPQIWGDL
jgi:hypothetical protein